MSQTTPNLIPTLPCHDKRTRKIVAIRNGIRQKKTNAEIAAEHPDLFVTGGHSVSEFLRHNNMAKNPYTASNRPKPLEPWERRAYVLRTTPGMAMLPRVILATLHEEGFSSVTYSRLNHFFRKITEGKVDFDAT